MAYSSIRAPNSNPKLKLLGNTLLAMRSETKLEEDLTAPSNALRKAA